MTYLCGCGNPAWHPHLERNGLPIGGPLIRGRVGRRGSAKARANVRREKRRVRRSRDKTGSLLYGSEKPSPKPGTYFTTNVNGRELRV